MSQTRTVAALLKEKPRRGLTHRLPGGVSEVCRRHHPVPLFQTDSAGCSYAARTLFRRDHPLFHPGTLGSGSRYGSQWRFSPRFSLPCSAEHRGRSSSASSSRSNWHVRAREVARPCCCRSAMPCSRISWKSISAPPTVRSTKPSHPSNPPYQTLP